MSKSRERCEGSAVRFFGVRRSAPRTPAQPELDAALHGTGSQPVCRSFFLCHPEPSPLPLRDGGEGPALVFSCHPKRSVFCGVEGSRLDALGCHPERVRALCERGEGPASRLCLRRALLAAPAPARPGGRRSESVLCGCPILRRTCEGLVGLWFCCHSEERSSRRGICIRFLLSSPKRI